MISDQNDSHGKHNDCHLLSFQVICFIVFVVFLVSSGLAQNDAYSSAPEDGLIELWRVHEQWQTAFENADIKAAESVWSHESDVQMIDLMGFESVGWKNVREQLALAFAILGRSQMVTWDVVVSVKGDQGLPSNEVKGSVTGKYILEGVFLSQTFKATELYRKENGQWKLYYDDSLGNQPL
jgi:ketosteroid isomerase-like protein